MVVKKNTQIIYFIVQPKSVELIFLQYLENFKNFKGYLHIGIEKTHGKNTDNCNKF